MVNIKVYLYDRVPCFTDVEYVIDNDGMLLIYKPNIYTGKIIAQFARWAGVVEVDA